jgi:hypothetical protein
MKTLLCLFAFLPVFILEVQSQTPNDTIKTSFPVKMGKITLKDGSSYTFTNLRYRNHIISFSDREMNNQHFNLYEIEKITKRSRSTVAGMCIGAGVGLIGGAAMYEVVEMEVTMVKVLFYLFTFGAAGNIETTKKEKSFFLIFSTLMGAGEGALVGTFIYHNKKIYASPVESIGMQPLIVPFDSKRPIIGLTLHVNLR